MTRLRRVVLTGGIASGKSAAAGFFQALGVPVVDTDAVAREVVEPGEPGLEAVVQAFGEAVLDASGHLDRRALRERIFADEDTRRGLEGILHPLIVKRVEAWLEKQTGTYALIVVPLYVETGTFRYADAVIVVDVPRAVQHERLIARDAMTAEIADAMIDAQATREQRLAAADHVIDNTGSLEDLEARVGEVHAALVETFH